MGILLALTLALAQDGLRAQDGLTPTDILPMGRFSADARLTLGFGQGTLDTGPATIDGDIQEFQVVFRAAAGLGMGFEIEAELPVAFTSELSFEESGAEYTQEAKGLGDLTFGANYAIIQQSKDEPQLIIGAFVVFPTGDDSPGLAEIVVNNVVVQAGEDAGIGTGAFGFGGQIGVSKNFGNIEPYLMFRYFVAGESEADDIETDYADVLTILLGMELHAGDRITVDLQMWVNMNGDEVAQDTLTNAESTEEAHASYGFQGRVFLSLGSSVAIVGGIGIAAVEDHAIDEEAQLDLTDTFIFGAEFGLRIVFGR